MLYRSNGYVRLKPIARVDEKALDPAPELVGGTQETNAQAPSARCINPLWPA